ncbi:MAG: DUF1287 domain-containing protein [Bacteroidales bacterium]|jgi:uncharacterized protein YijF (DUF1287 family)|nr:DUF1287 domain-containing protein [Bacteroidales bacterium]
MIYTEIERFSLIGKAALWHLTCISFIYAVIDFFVELFFGTIRWLFFLWKWVKFHCTIRGKIAVVSVKKLILGTLFFFGVTGTIIAQNDFFQKLSEAAMSLTKQKVQYDPNYYVINYPNGDVPKNKGVCTDVIVRAYRAMNIDLQREVHEDMSANFSLYPNNWGLTAPDHNIDHRRVPNLMTYFSRFGDTKPVTKNPEDYLPGDIVCWDLGNGVKHIGLIVKEKSEDGLRHCIVHNIGSGQVVEDCLFSFEIIGHYAYKK